MAQSPMTTNMWEMFEFVTIFVQNTLITLLRSTYKCERALELETVKLVP